jgi:predicted ATP-binding protein involved in virulence
MNLIVGVNGAGKSTVLESLSILLSQALSKLDPDQAPSANGFDIDDIRHGEPGLAGTLSLRISETKSVELSSVRQRTQYVDSGDGTTESFVKTEDGFSLRTIEEQADKTALSTAERIKARNKVAHAVKPSIDFNNNRPLILLFSVDRTRASYEVQKTLKNVHPAYAGVFSTKRGFNIEQVVAWWESKFMLSRDYPESTAAKQLGLIQQALNTLCPRFKNWRLELDESKDIRDLWVDKTLKKTALDNSGNLIDTTREQALRVRQLSDGERSIISMAFDIARRLILLNESDDDPVKNGRGIVLIDEIDLHLHPEWQRRIVIDLPRVFPNLQFIATTHSPQTIGETAPGHVIILEEGGKVRVEPESLGRSSGWILRHIMGSSERNDDLKQGLKKIDQFIDDDEYAKARELIASLRETFGNDPELIGAEACVNRWEFADDEENS